MRKIFLSIILILLFSGCGHNMSTNSKGIGIDISWNGNGYIPNLRLGYWDVASSVLRGNSTYTSNTSTGASAWLTGGTSQTIHLATGTQFNEGNIAEVLTSKNVTEKTKSDIIKYVTQTRQPFSQPSLSKTIGAAGSTGNNPREVSPETTGVDKIVDKVGEVTNTAIPAVQKVAEKTVTTVPNALSNITKYLIIGIVALVIVIIIFLIIILKKKKQQKLNKII